MSKPTSSLENPHWLVATGNFFFRYRNALFPVILGLLVFVTRPHSVLAAERHWLTLGIGLALIGEAIRLLTIGYDYIDRGGRGGKVFASRLVQGGIYAHVRNPMYVGNLLMAAGLLIFSGSLTALLVALPFFVFVYVAIIAAEEAYLKKSFGEDYVEYCQSVPRLMPRLRGLVSQLSRVRYDWKKALRKDYGNLYFLGMSLIVLTVWRAYFLEGDDYDGDDLPQVLRGIFTATTVYLTVMYLKKTHRLD